jgi:hypothetical protein
MKALFATATAAAALAGALLAAPSTALADDDRRGWGRHGGWDNHRHGYHGHRGGPPPKHWHKHHYKHYGPPPHVYYGPPRVVYRAPVYAPPPPVVVYPRPYPPVGHVSIGFGFDF